MTKHDVINLKNLNGLSQSILAVPSMRRLKVVIFLTDAFSLLSLTSITDVFSAVQTVSAGNIVQTQLLTIRAQSIRSQSGVTITPDLALPENSSEYDTINKLDFCVICSGTELSAEETNETLKLIRFCRRNKIPVCIIGAAVISVARNGYICKGTDHWSRIPGLREVTPELELENAIFIQDGINYSCAGELGAMDFALNCAGDHFGADVASLICNHLLVQSCRAGNQTQTCTAVDRFKGAPEKLLQAIDLMLSNIEEPISITEISRRLHVSVRQVERMFSRYLSVSPIKFYIRERLTISINLIQQTNMTHLEIALACGFGSPSALSWHFKNEFGYTPSKARNVFRLH